MAWIPWARSTGVRCNNSSALKYQVDFTTSTKFKGPDCPGVRLKDLAAETRGGMGAAPLCVCVCLQRSQPSSEAGWDVHASVCVCIKRKGVGVRGGLSRQEGQTLQPQDKLTPPNQKKVGHCTAHAHLRFVMEKQSKDWWREGTGRQGRVGGGAVCVMLTLQGGFMQHQSPRGISSVSGGVLICVCVRVSHRPLSLKMSLLDAG